MNLFPAIDLVGGSAVRLLRGDYNRMTVYDNDPLHVAKKFAACGARYLHVVDLEGARDGSTANYDTICRLIRESGLQVEVGGGIRSLEIVKKYLDAGAFRVILGTAAVTDPDFLDAAVATYGNQIAVGVDIKDGMVAIKGWREVSTLGCYEFCKILSEKGISTVICTDISKDGVMAGTNLALYRELQNRFDLQIVASGGVSSEDDVRELTKMRLYGAILGKALYTEALDLKRALQIVREVDA